MEEEEANAPKLEVQETRHRKRLGVGLGRKAGSKKVPCPDKGNVIGMRVAPNRDNENVVALRAAAGLEVGMVSGKRCLR